MVENNKNNQKRLWRQSLLGYCQKIINGIGELKADSEQRAIWELVQNARDVSSKEHSCTIEIILTEDKLIFAHKGDPFTIDSLGALVMQNSSKNSNDEIKVGQYGTGFMITHTFNRIVQVDGTFEDTDDDGRNLAYYSLDNFTIDRTAYTPESLCIEMQAALDEIVDIPSKNQKICAPKEWTRFSYQLTRDKANRIDIELNKMKRYVPIVLLLNKSIKQISIINNISKYKSIFSLGTTQAEKLEGIEGWSFVKQIVEHKCKNKEDVEIIDLCSLQSLDEQDIIVIPPYPEILGDINDYPSLFLHFPLLGTEQFGLNFIFHSKAFYPVEERNGIILPQDEAQYPEKNEANEQVLRRMFDALFAYYANSNNAFKLPIDCCKVQFGINNIDIKDHALKTFYDHAQKLWAQQIRKWKVIPTSDGGKSALIDNRVRVLAADFYRTLKDDEVNVFEKTISSFGLKTRLANGESVILPEENHLIEWSKIVNNWNIEDESNYVITIKEVCESIKERSEDLHKFLEWLNTIGSTEIFEDIALIPNREDEALCLRSKLQDGKTISKDLYKLARPILAEKLDCLVDEQYADLYTFPEYTRSNLQSDLTTTISALRKQTVTSSTPAPIEESILGKDLLYALISYCSSFHTESSTSLRRQIMPYICKIYGQDITIKLISNEGNIFNGNTIDIYETCFNYLLENTFLSISKKDSEWVKANKSTLFEFIKTLLCNTRDQEHIDRIKKYAIFPNRLGQLHQVDSLKKVENISEEFVKEYNSLTGQNLYESWVDESFESLWHFSEVKPKELGVLLENDYLRPYLALKHEKDKDFQYNELIEKSMLTIVHHIENKNWNNYFDYFVTNLHAISYELGTKEQKEALYTIKLNIKDQNTLDKIAELSKSPDLAAVLKNASDIIEQEKERDRQFRFTFAIGKQIENVIRNEVREELSVEFCKQEDVSTRDEQGGQDIIIRDEQGNDLYYIECKAKWEFHNAPAHMSTLQIKQAVKNQDRYALLCVDCTRDTGAKIDINASTQDLTNSIQEVLLHTTAHCDIGKSFNTPIGALVKYEEEMKNKDGEQNIKLNSTIGCDIPKSIFNEGISFDEFMSFLKTRLKKEIKNN